MTIPPITRHLPPLSFLDRVENGIYRCLSFPTNTVPSHTCGTRCIKFLKTAATIAAYATVIIPLVAAAFYLRKTLSHRHITLTPPTLLSPSSPESYTSEVSQDLVKKKFLDHSSITSILSRERDILVTSASNSYFFVQRTSLEENAQDGFTLKPSKKTPADIKAMLPRPTTGGLCLSIHDASRQHFTGLFVDFSTKQLFYYDPLGDPPTLRANALINKVLGSVFGNDIVEIIDISTQHQKDGYNCGRYVIHFLKTMMSSTDHTNTISTLQKNLSREDIEAHAKAWAIQYDQKS